MYQHDLAGRHSIVYTISSEAGGSGDTEHPIGVVPFFARVKEVTVMPMSNLAGDGSNYLTLSIKTKHAASPLGTNLTLATTGDLKKGIRSEVQWSMDLNATNTADPINSGTVITFSKEETGSQTLPESVVVVEFEGSGRAPTTSTSTSTSTTSTSSSTTTTSSTSSSTSTTTTSTSTSSSTSTSTTTT